MARRREENAAYIFSVKEGVPCTDCKQHFPPYCMDFDHLTNKKCNVSRMANSAYKLDTIKLEIAKCELVCSNCHRIRTFKREQPWIPPLGTPSKSVE